MILVGTFVVIVGTGGAFTVSVREQAAVPPAPITVPVYVVVVRGPTEVEPLGTETYPIFVMWSDVAFVVDHVSVVDAA